MKNSRISEKFDVAIVGAGPAGVTAALGLARAGLNVILFERGEEPGQKNMFGGVLHYSEALHELVPDFWKYAPVERYITKYKTTLLTEDASTTFSYDDDKFARPPYNGFSLLRAKFDSWYAGKAQEAGALLVTETTVDDLLWEGRQVIGVQTGRRNGAVRADCVILADGANSLLAKRAGLRKEHSPHDFSVAAKEILALPRETIEERFQLRGNEGVAHIFAGECTQGIEGGAFLYTNSSSISIGVTAKLNALNQSRTSIADLLEKFKARPSLRRVIKGATVKEYLGHLIPESGMHMMPQLCGNGVLLAGDAAGLVCSTGLTFQGMNFAMTSGHAAAKTVMKAKEKGDFSSRQLATYKKDLEESVVLKDLKTFRHAPEFLSNPNLYDIYPSMFCGVAGGIYRVDGQPRKKIMHLLRRERGGKISMWRFIKDIIQGARALL